MIAFDELFIIGTMFVVLRERHRRRGFIGNRFDLRLYSQLTKVRKHAVVKIRDCQPVVEVETLPAAAARRDHQRMAVEVELDLELSTLIWDVAC